MDEDLSLGKCCICEAENRSVRNLITLHKRIPEGEKGGWGCFTCGLPARGAVAVLCDDCLDKTMADESIEIKFACLGDPGENRRIEINELTEDFDHDMSKHPEENSIALIESVFEDMTNQAFREYIGAPDDCGLREDGLCTKAGSEECDWECPYSN